jgi:transaldolase
VNPARLTKYGQSYWLDNLTRRMITDGSLARRVKEEGLGGVTSNPAIFHKAITRSGDYDDQIRQGALAGLSARELYEDLTTTDVRAACDILRPVFDRTRGADGFVSLEVSPHLAHDTAGSIAEAGRLHGVVDRPNLLIKIPGTAAGVPAVEELLFDAINVNVTLLFAVESYQAVAEAYLRALERRLEAGRPIDNIASVASFFLSRIDVLVDKLLGDSASANAASLLGKAAIANAQLAYARFLELLGGKRWQALAQRGARQQRLLWASTGTKNPAYRDVMYVEPLIGAYTVNTMPEETIAAFADHGEVGNTVASGIDDARQVMAALEEAGIDFCAITVQLESEGIEKFIEPYDVLLDVIDGKLGNFRQASA